MITKMRLSIYYVGRNTLTTVITEQKEEKKNIVGK